MELRFKIRPYRTIVRNTDINTVKRSENLYPNVYSGYGSYKETYDSGYGQDRSAVVYDIEVQKRGDHRGHIQTTVRMYKIPLKVLEIMNSRVEQGRRNFRIVSK